jgi:hypothetical protein
MTLQVGMLGTNGVVLAGDMRVSRNPLAGVHAPRQTYQGPKIQISDNGRIAVSCARDMQAGKDVARAIFDNMTHGDHPSCEREIKDIGSAAAQGRNVECIVTFADPLPCLYIFQYINDGNDVECQRIISCISAGDTRNPAVFWGSKYYEMFDNLPISQLKHLAACMVVSAGDLNSAVIGGLDVVFCTTSEGCKPLSDDAVRELESSARDKIRRMGEFIFGDTTAL